MAGWGLTRRGVGAGDPDLRTFGLELICKSQPRRAIAFVRPGESGGEPFGHPCPQIAAALGKDWDRQPPFRLGLGGTLRPSASPLPQIESWAHSPAFATRVRLLRGPKLSTCPWCRRRSNVTLTAGALPVWMHLFPPWGIGVPRLHRGTCPWMRSNGPSAST